MPTSSFLPADYGPAVSTLTTPARLSVLGPGSPNRVFRDALLQFNPSTDLGVVRNSAAASACLAGLWLYHDFHDESHAISQNLDTPEGSFWHAILHRREPDPSNSKYWWRKVGPHTVLDRLRELAPKIGYEFTTPFAFVDFVEQVRGTGSSEEEIARRVQNLEWQLLFDWCFAAAK